MKNKKLLLSKWTAVNPENKEKHFLVTKLIEDDIPIYCVIEAVYSHQEYTIEIQTLNNTDYWLRGWL